MPYTFQISGGSHQGRVRSRNEDSFGVNAEAGVAVVADGMGGHPGGHLASRLAAEATRSALEDRTSPDHAPRDLADAMARSVMAGHQAIRSAVEDGRGTEGMGTTVVAWAADAAHGGWVVGHVGDSRAYRWSRGRLEPLTSDDTWLQARVETGEISPEEARGHPLGHMLSQCVGMEDEPHPHVRTGRLSDGERYLLCSDGLTGMLDDDVLATILAEHPDPESAAEALVTAAVEEGGRDNVTVVVVAVSSLPPGG